MNPKKKNWWEVHNERHGWEEEDLIEDETDEQELDEERQRLEDEEHQYLEDLYDDYDG